MNIYRAGKRRGKHKPTIIETEVPHCFVKISEVIINENRPNDGRENVCTYFLISGGTTNKKEY